MKRTIPHLRIISAALVLILFIGCQQDHKVRIAISKGSGSENYGKYSEWLMSFSDDIECIDMYHIDREKALELLEGCSGLLLSGGPDVHPDHYGQIDDSARCEIDHVRDTLEFALIEKAKEMNLPILGICRGEQILNVAYGGSLIVDIPEDHDTIIIHKCSDPSDCYHAVDIEKNTILHQHVNTIMAMVNTNHHQAVNKLADEFRASAYSKDGIIEAFEWKEPEGKPFLLAVQWHPERMERESPLSANIGKEFIHNVMVYYDLSRNNKHQENNKD